MWGQRCGGWEKRAQTPKGKVRNSGFISRVAGFGIGSHKRVCVCVHLSLAGSHEKNSLEGAVGSRVSPQTSLCWQPHMELESLQV